MAEFKAVEYLESQGLSLVDANADGTLTIQSQDGKTGKFDPKEFLRSQGVDPKAINILANTPETALAVSPVSKTDRVAMSFGNDKGVVNYLSKKYEAVETHKDKGIVVKDKGVWKQVDPSLFSGDGWSISEAIGDIADVAGPAVNVAGSVTGALVGAMGMNPGSVVLGSTLGAGLTKWATTNMGRLAGTYDATTAEQVADIGWDMVLNLGGYAIAPTLKLGNEAIKKGFAYGVEKVPSVGVVFNALSNIKNKAATSVKETARYVMTSMSGVKERSAERLLNIDPQGVRAVVNNYVEGSKFKLLPTQIQDEIRASALSTTNAYFRLAERTLKNNFKTLESKFLSTADDSLKVPIEQTAQNVMQMMARDGLVKPVFGSSGKLLSYSTIDREALQKALDMPGISVGRVKSVLDNLVSVANKQIGKGELSGKAGAQALLEFRRKLDDVYFTATKQNPRLQDVIREYSLQARNALTSSIGKASIQVQKTYKNMNAYYSNNVDDVVELAAKAEQKGAESFLSALWSNGNNATEWTKFNKLQKLNIAPNGESLAKYNPLKHLADRIQNREAALDFISSFPHVGGPQGFMSKTAGAALGATKVLSPRTQANVLGKVARPNLMPEDKAAKVLPYAEQLNAALKLMPVKERVTAFPLLAGQTLQAIQAEEVMKSQLLEKAGIGPQQGQSNGQ